MSLLVTSMVLSGLLVPGAAARPGTPREPAQRERALRADPVERPDHHADLVDRTAAVRLADLPAEPPAQPARPRGEPLFGSDCDTVIEGSRVTAHCHNPFPRTDLVRLHVECERWWDVDGDSAPVSVEPAGHVRLASRCWKEVRSAWVSHEPGG
ncbi:hypothetical protein [Streptomyces sp. NPDC097619]|uniref:hypothetical protein n=1 Tax=Streptomyces sp. NPDC097619 TaxID=3157228 RepID=UPI0033301B30